MKKKLRVKLSSLVGASLYVLLMIAPYTHIAGIVCPHESAASNSSLKSQQLPDDFNTFLEESHAPAQVDSDCKVCQLLTSCFYIDQIESKSAGGDFAYLEIFIQEDVPLCKKTTTSNPPTGPPAS